MRDPISSLSTNKPCLAGENTAADQGSPTYSYTIVQLWRPPSGTVRTWAYNTVK